MSPLLLLAMLMQAGQGPPPPPLIRVTTRVVEVTLVATRRNGVVEADLQASEIHVLDNGRPQTIAAFERLASGGGDTKAAAEPHPGPSAAPPKIYSVILLDALNTRWSDSAFARAEVVRTLLQIRPEERIALFVLGDGLRVLHDFSSSSASLLARLKAAPARAASDGDLAPDWPFSAALSYGELFRPRGARGAGNFYQTRRILDTFQAIEAIANYVRGVPGRKNLLWVSAGFPLAIGMPERNDGVDMSKVRTFGAELDKTTRALNAANLAVYPIDARGLTPGNPYINVSTMQQLARQTGGVAYYNRNDLHRAVREALDDSRDVYSLSYTPQPFAEDGSFHRIRIRTARRGLDLRYRQGYFASADATR